MRGRGATSLVEVVVVAAIGAVLLGLTLGAVSRVRAAAARASCQNNMRLTALGFHLYTDTHKVYPPGFRRSPDPMPFASWLTRLLPHVEQDAVWREAVAEFRREPYWARPPRHSGESRTIPTYLCPAEPLAVGVVPRDEVTVAFTHYLGVAGTATVLADGCIYPDSRLRPLDVTDGLSSTLLIGERPPSQDLHFGWWYAGVGQFNDGSADMHLGVREYVTTFRAPTCYRRDAGFRAGSRNEMCDTFHFWSNHPGGANFALCDGSVRFLRYTGAPILPALATRAGGEVAELPE